MKTKTLAQKQKKEVEKKVFRDKIHSKINASAKVLEFWDNPIDDLYNYY